MQAPTYYTTYSGKLPVFRHPKFVIKQSIDFEGVSYSHYYDWLRQSETSLAFSPLTHTHTLRLTSKHLIMQDPHKKLAFPLQKVQKVSIAFKRLLFPLISGGISTPLFGVALWNQLISFWFGIGVVFIGLSLLYYGWLGTHQVSIDLSQETINYFTDHKTPELESLVKQTNELVKQRKEH